MFSVEIIPHRLHFNQPFVIAYETVNCADVVVVALSDGPYTGLGSASPSVEYVGETIESTLEILNKYITSDFFDRPLDDLVYYHEKIQQVLGGFPSSQSAVEEALLNLHAMRLGITLADVFGGALRSSFPIMFTLDMQDIAGTLIEARERVEQGYTVLKLKCGLDPEKDIEKIKRLSIMLPSTIKLTLDANQGYDTVNAEKVLRAVDQYDRVVLIEQPTPERDWDALKYLRSVSRIPIVADESAVSVEDTISLLKGDYVDGVNIKLMKCGGPLNFITLFKETCALGKIAMMGCVYESNISITTGAYLALTLPLDYIDLDSGHLDFLDDPAAGGVKFDRGIIKSFSPMLLRKIIESKVN